MSVRSGFKTNSHRSLRVVAVVFVMLAVLLQAFADGSARGTAVRNEQSVELFSQPQIPARRVGTTITIAELQFVNSKISSASQFLDRFWRQTFTAHGWFYSSPRIMEDGESAYYTPSTHTIHFNPVFFVEQMRAAAGQTKTDGDFAPITILAHEWGHSIQRQLGINAANNIDQELQADCFAGAFAKAARDAGVLDPGDIDEATYTLFSGRDATGTSPYYSNAHGNGTQRVDAYLSGLKSGVRGCGIR
ncbi:MAG TPA: neutral zinc metallopeptidase [Blastocatellia bacterium]|nr:neutral zinc metallopeptidase [Blastocatellia bacterium]